MAIETFFHGFRESQKAVVTATSTLQSKGNQHVDVDTSGGAVTLTLPAPEENAWQHISVRKIGGGTNALTMAGVTGQGDGTTALATMEDDGDRAVFLSDGVSWFTIAQYIAD